MIVTVVTVRCDRCNWYDERSQGGTRQEAGVKAQEAGWSITQRRHLCNACRGDQP